jgi:hypothetical protein
MVSFGNHLIILTSFNNISSFGFPDIQQSCSPVSSFSCPLIKLAMFRISSMMPCSISEKNEEKCKRKIIIIPLLKNQLNQTTHTHHAKSSTSVANIKFATEFYDKIHLKADNPIQSTKDLNTQD